MKKLLAIAGLATVLSSPAFALTNICWSPDESCTAADDETKIYLDKSTSVVGAGHVGSQAGLPEVQFVSSTVSDYKNGFATVKPTSVDAIYSFDIEVPGHTFGDLLWDVQMFDTKVKGALFTFNAYAYLGGTLQDFHSFTGLGHDSDLSFGAFATDGGQFDELYLTSDTGFKELKHFQISELDGLSITPVSGGVPEPSTWAMGIVGFALIAGMGWKRSRRDRLATV